MANARGEAVLHGQPVAVAREARCGGVLRHRMRHNGRRDIEGPARGAFAHGGGALLVGELRGWGFGLMIYTVSVKLAVNVFGRSGRFISEVPPDA